MFQLVVQKSHIQEYGPTTAVVLSFLMEKEYKNLQCFGSEKKFTYSKKELAKDTGLTRERLQTALKQLESLSIIKQDSEVLKGMNFIIFHNYIAVPF